MGSSVATEPRRAQRTPRQRSRARRPSSSNWINDGREMFSMSAVSCVFSSACTSI